jgi:hypothetical protein
VGLCVEEALQTRGEVHVGETVQGGADWAGAEDLRPPTRIAEKNIFFLILANTIRNSIASAVCVCVCVCVHADLHVWSVCGWLYMCVCVLVSLSCVSVVAL